MKCFISHIHEEKPMAVALKSTLEERVPSCEVWVSSVDVAYGEQWLSALESAIEKADKVLVLCSQNALKSPWIHFEAGVGQGRDSAVVPICHTDMQVADLHIPFSVLQSKNLYTIENLRDLIDSFGGDTTGLESDWQSLMDAQTRVDYVPLAVKPLRNPTSERSILVDGAHAQRKWSGSRRGTVFERAKSNFAGISSRTGLDVQFIDDPDQIRASDMEPWSGLILALPLHEKIKSASIEQIVEWVQSGGRLLLMGFELGDLHHEGNLNDLAARFALRFNGDMVAPAGWKTGKPYGKDIAFEVPQSQGLLEGVNKVVWQNVQTLASEPGTTPHLNVGSQALAVPTPNSVISSGDGSLAMPNPEFVIENRAEWLPVLAEATRELTGNGAVMACGTWDVIPETAESNDNERFVSNLLKWLTAT